MRTPPRPGYAPADISCDIGSMPGVACDPPPKRLRARRMTRAAAMLCALGLALPLLGQSQMNVGNPPPPPPPQVHTPYPYPYPYGLAPRPKKKKDRCAALETPYERSLCEDESTSGTKARCGADKTPCSN